MSRRTFGYKNGGQGALGTAPHFAAGLAIVLAALVVCGLAAAGDGRDFAGSYALSDVTDLGPEMRLTLTLRVHNFSGADVPDATITLEDSLFPDTSYGRFEHVSIGLQDSVRLREVFLVARSEYEVWQAGGTPHLRIQFRDAAGKTVERLIELAPGLMEEEE